MSVIFIQEAAQLERALPSLMRTPVAGLDTETSGLDPHRDKVVMLQIGTPNAQLVIDTRSCPLGPLRPWLESKEHKKILHNGLFDYKFMRGTFGICLENIRDTFLAEQLLMNGLQFRGFGLADVAKKYLGVDLDKKVRGTFGTAASLKGAFSKEQIEYGARDVSHLMPIAAAQSEKLIDLGLGETWILESEFVPALGDLEFDGLYLDKDSWQSIIDDNTRAAEEVQRQLDELASAVLPSNLFGEVDINWGSPQQVLDLLRRYGVKIPVWNKHRRMFEEHLIDKTDDKTLKKVKDYPIVKLLKEHRSLQIRINTFGHPYLQAIHPLTGKLHPSYAQLGTGTGRLAKGRDSDVNLLNIPRDKRMRHSFRGEPDEMVETHDYNGAELRIWADISGDPNLCEAYARGVDIHCYVASKLFKREVTKKDPIRQPTKSMNFGIIYGMMPKALCDRINGEGYPITLSETEEMYDLYVKEFKVGIDYLRSVGKQAASTGTLQSISGRRRNWILPDPSDREKFPQGKNDWGYKGILSKIEREAGNFPIQSVNADFTKKAMIDMRPHMKEWRSKFSLQVYDEIVTRTHESKSEEFALWKKKVMIDAAHKYLTRVQMDVEFETERTWTK